ncbi:glycosyltransferase [Candidatus Kaiserbacteria bacterium]|nr:glycosyltransferase [Candidatus Kaiserbacteria bacterium]
MAIFSHWAKGKKAERQEPWVTPEERAVRSIESVISSGDHDAEDIVVLDKKLKPKEPLAPALQPPPPPEPPSDRGRLRVLIIATDASLLTPGSAAGAEYVALADYLDEVHVIVMTKRSEATYKPLRLAPNVWVYPTNSRSSLFAVYDTYRITSRQIAFGDNFRADMVVATDAFEAGVAAYIVARRHERPLQLQLSVNPFEEGFAEERDGNRWRLFVAKFLIPRAECVLARSKSLETELDAEYSDIADRINVLPAFHNLAAYRDAVPHFDLHERYPRFRFIVLVVGRLDARSGVEFAIDVCAPILQQYVTIGLVIVGEGPLRKQIERKIIGLNLQNQIVVESNPDDLVSHMKSSNLLLNPVASEENDTLLAAAAASGLPVLTVHSGMADTLFTDNVNAFICPENDKVCLQARIGEFLNDNQLRTAFSINSRDQVFSVMEQDVDAYRRAFIDTFTTCMLKTFTEEKL